MNGPIQKLASAPIQHDLEKFQAEYDGFKARLKSLEADGKRVWAYKHALQPPHEPKKLLVIGSGATAMTLVPPPIEAPTSTGRPL